MAKKPRKVVASSAPAAPAAPSYNVEILRSVVFATKAGSFAYVAAADYEPLVTAGFAEINATTVDSNGNVATRATAAGIAAIDTPPAAPAPASNAGTNTATPRPQPSDFVIEDNVPLPAIRRGAIAGASYPFDALQAGQSFFVPAADGRPNPAKSLASTVSSASNRYFRKTGTNPDGSEVGVYDRKFTVRSVDEPGKGKGARVFRVS